MTSCCACKQRATGALCAAYCRGDGQEEDASAARSTEGIAVLNIDQFSELLSWGIVMGVSNLCYTIWHRPSLPAIAFMNLNAVLLQKGGWIVRGVHGG